MQESIIIGKKVYTIEQAKRTSTLCLIIGLVIALVGVVLIPFGILLILAGIALIAKWRQINSCLKAFDQDNSGN